jgi:hypothetical protein
MALSRVTTWSSGDTLTAAALNGEFNSILNNAVALLSPWTANMDANGKQLQNHVLETFAAAQTAATAGRLYYRSDTKIAEYDTGAAIRSVPNFVDSGGQLTLSGASLLFSPYTHNLIAINGRLEVIPDAGVSLAIGAAAASTAYNIYAYMSGSTMTLEFSATATALQAGTGVTIKSGDATRSFVGTDTTTGAPAWSTPSSFFHGASAGATIAGSVNLTSGDISTASATLVDLTGATTTLTTAARRALIVLTGTFSSSGDGIVVNFAVDGTLQIGTSTTSGVRHGKIAGQQTVIAVSFITAALTAASHVFKAQWTVSGGGGTATFYADTTNPLHFSVAELGAIA